KRAKRAGIGGDGRRADRYLARLARLAIDEEQVATERRVDLLGREYLNEVDVEPPIREFFEHSFVSRIVEKIRENEENAGFRRLATIAIERGREVRRRVRRERKPVEKLKERDELSPPTRRA